ncbi:Kinetochore protein NDC80 -like protein [Trichinella spiralis]|uniref:Kinetochore protein NDC80 n=1 Tax=Trichinella spiralis TaxID=6334 RepID=A0A0V1BR46_TRISP|nr:Kinetochore protein NDC80 -like protein [Trichinella spiralis]
MDESNFRLYATPAANVPSSTLLSAIMKQEQSEDACNRVNVVYLENSFRKTTLEKDQRPLNDKQFVANMIKEVSAFFLEAIMGCPIQINKFEEDILRYLKELEYPYLVKKSTLQTLSAPSSIPHIIGIFYWFVEEIKVRILFESVEDDLLAKQDLVDKLDQEVVEVEKQIEQSEQFFVALKNEHDLADKRKQELKLLIESKHAEEQEAIIALDKRKQSFNASQNLKTKTERVEQQIQIAKEQLAQVQNHRSGLTNSVILSQERTVIRQDKMLMNNKQMELNDALVKTTLELKQVECLRSQTEKRLNEMQKKHHAKEMHMENERTRRAELIKQWFDEFEQLREYVESLENDNYEDQLLKLQEDESEINDSYNNSINEYLLFLKQSNAKISSLLGWMSVWFQFSEYLHLVPECHHGRTVNVVVIRFV